MTTSRNSILFAVFLATLAAAPAFAGSSGASEAAPHCDASLWQHVYAGDPRRFDTPQDRLHVIRNCVEVTGTIVNARAERDGDWHLRLKLDPPYRNMLDDKNISEQHGDLVLEPVCSNPVHQRDTIKEGACDGFHQHIFDESMVGEHVKVVGAYVTDMEHGWHEIHPVTSITPTN